MNGINISIAAALRDGRATPSTAQPPSLAGRRISVRTGVVLAADFVTGHPNNNLRTEGAFVEVQRQVGGQWTTVSTDSEWQTIYRWKREYLSVSTAQITWTIPADAAPRTYRIVHRGDAKGLTGRITAFTGTNRTFTVVA